MNDAMKQVSGLVVGLVCWFLFLVLLFNEATMVYALAFLSIGILLKLVGSFIRLPGNALLSGMALILILPFEDERAQGVSHASRKHC